MRNDFTSNYLEHSAKGTSWKNVKYLKKVLLGTGKYLYLYTQQQVDAWNRRHSIDANNKVLSDKYKDQVKNEVLKTQTKSIEELQKTNFAVKGNTTAEKKKNLEKDISNGEKKIQEELNKEAAKKTAEKKTSEDKDSKSSKKSGSGSSGSSGKKSGGSGSKGSSGSKSKGSGASKEKSASSKKAASEKTAKTASAKQQEKKAQNDTPINMDTLKKIYGAKDEDVTTHDMTAPEFKNKMLSKYDEGSFGYLMAGDKAYKWTIEGGQLILKDFDTDKDVSFDTYLKDVKQFKEFQTNKKKK